MLVAQLKSFRIRADHSLRLNLDELNSFLRDKTREAKDGLGPEVFHIGEQNAVVRFYDEISDGE
jgi:hypothetical protein